MNQHVWSIWRAHAAALTRRSGDEWLQVYLHSETHACKYLLLQDGSLRQHLPETQHVHGGAERSLGDRFQGDRAFAGHSGWTGTGDQHPRWDCHRLRHPGALHQRRKTLGVLEWWAVGTAKKFVNILWNYATEQTDELTCEPAFVNQIATLSRFIRLFFLSYSLPPHTGNHVADIYHIYQNLTVQDGEYKEVICILSF